LMIIIGLVVLIIAGFLFNSSAERARQEIEDDRNTATGIPQIKKAVNEYLINCMESGFQRSKFYVGVNEDSAYRYRQEINDSVTQCLKDSKEEMLGYSFEVDSQQVDAEIDEDHMAFTLSMPSRIFYGNQVLEFDKFVFQVNKISWEPVEQDSSGTVLRDTRIVSTDGSVIIEIPEGTQITKDGFPFAVDKIWMKMTSPEKAYLIDSIDRTLYIFEPTGIRFSQPIDVIFKVPEGFLDHYHPTYIRYCRPGTKECIFLKTIPDRETSVITARFDEFI
jgi:hypothetical protein